MEKQIKLELLASLKRFQPETTDSYPIATGMTIRDLLMRLGIPEYEVNLIFVDGAKANLDRVLNGGERVGLFPPLCGG